MKERPILFSAPDVRAILEGRKTQTRRVVKDAHGAFWDHGAWLPVVDDGRVEHWECSGGQIIHWEGESWDPEAKVYASLGPSPVCPYGGPGDRLWVRETWHRCPHCGARAASFRADGDLTRKCRAHGWEPPLAMPRQISRITLEVTDVRVERIQDISEADACAEGALSAPGFSARKVFWSQWDADHGIGSWVAHVWVWAIHFKRITEEKHT